MGDLEIQGARQHAEALTARCGGPEFIIVLRTAMVALPLPVSGQQPRPLLAILLPASAKQANESKLIYEPFKQALARLRWEPGRNIDIIERFADGDDSRLCDLPHRLAWHH